jgi:CheY-like chemotaxis protein
LRSIFEGTQLVVKNDNNILLVDDSDDDAYLFEKAVANSGRPARLVRCKHGSECQEYLDGTSDNALPRLIVLDQRLGDTSGLELLRWIKQHKEMQAVPVVILAGILSWRDEQLLWETGAHALHLKPTGMHALERFAAVLCEYWLDWVITPEVGNRQHG